MSKIYKYDDMEKLSQKIKKIKKKKYLEEIRDIIITNNPKLNITENSYGIYLCFNELTNDTFIKLEKYVKKCLEIEDVKKNNSEFNFINSLQSDNNNEEKKQNNNFFDNNSRLKFSNKEKNLLKKKLYDNALKINSEVNNYEKNYLNSITLSATEPIDNIDCTNTKNNTDNINNTNNTDNTDNTNNTDIKNDNTGVIKEDKNLKIFLKKNKKS